MGSSKSNIILALTFIAALGLAIYLIILSRKSRHNMTTSEVRVLKNRIGLITGLLVALIIFWILLFLKSRKSDDDDQIPLTPYESSVVKQRISAASDYVTRLNQTVQQLDGNDDIDNLQQIARQINDYVSTQNLLPLIGKSYHYTIARINARINDIKNQPTPHKQSLLSKVGTSVKNIGSNIGTAILTSTDPDRLKKLEVVEQQPKKSIQEIETEKMSIDKISLVKTFPVEKITFPENIGVNGNFIYDLQPHAGLIDPKRVENTQDIGSVEPFDRDAESLATFDKIDDIKLFSNQTLRSSLQIKDDKKCSSRKNLVAVSLRTHDGDRVRNKVFIGCKVKGSNNVNNIILLSKNDLRKDEQ